jgi:hypothetical protein
MGDALRLYISAGPELEPERDAIGQALAEFPVNLGWEIKRTPHAEEPVDLEAVRNCEFFVLLFSSDIRAPVGWEWTVARGTGRVILAFLRRDRPQTPAGREFARNLKTEWRPFDHGHDLARQLMESLSGRILDRWREFGLSAHEWEVLSAYVARLRAGKLQETPEAEPAGAGEGGVILAPGRDVPKGGLVVGG